MTRKSVAKSVQTEVLIKSGRRCSLCFGLNGDLEIKQGQIAHLDQNKTNNKFFNLIFLCLPHHDAYDSKTSQSKGITKDELKKYREALYQKIEQLKLPASTEVGDYLDRNTALLFMAVTTINDRETLEFWLKLIDDREVCDRLRSVWEFLQQPAPPEVYGEPPAKDTIDTLLSELSDGATGKKDTKTMLTLAKVAFENESDKNRLLVIGGVSSETLKQALLLELHKP